MLLFDGHDTPPLKWTSCCVVREVWRNFSGSFGPDQALNLIRRVLHYYCIITLLLHIYLYCSFRSNIFILVCKIVSFN